MVKNNAHYANSELAMNPDNPAWHSTIEPSMDVEAAGDIDWDDSADFIVVGFGGAGATAALRARENGLDVIALDCADGGGATLASGGGGYCYSVCQWRARFSGEHVQLFETRDSGRD